MRYARTALTALLVVFLAGCAVPLGPGYTIERQQILLTYSPQSPGRVHVTSTFRLKNTGSRDLVSLRTALPLEFKNLRVIASNAPLAPGPAEKTEHAAIVPLPFSSPLAQQARLELILEYDLEISAETFYFPYSGWFGELRPPEGFLAKGDPRANKIDFTVRVPENYRVLAGGLARGPKKRSPRQSRGGPERDFRFRLRENDFDLFVLAGPYLEQEFRSSGATIVFWTLQPLSLDHVQSAASGAAQAIRAYEEAFGPRIRPHAPVWVVEFSNSTWLTTAPGESAPISSFPHGVRIHSDWLRNRAGNPGFAASFDFALAELWFTHLTTPEPDIGVLDSSLSVYAEEMVRESRGTPAERRAFLAERLRAFDAVLAGEKETPLISLQRPAPVTQLRSARLKAVLFLFALEEKVGKEKLRKSIQQVVQALRGSTYGWSELRSALEAESGQDLGEMFRAWLTQPGIPDGFRKRYSSAPPAP